MATKNDPYYDDDAIDVNIGTGGQAPLLRTLKQMGDTIRQGGFCTAKKEENIVKSETEKAVDTTMDTNSLSDNSHEELLENVKSVSFTTQPLIVDDLEVPDADKVEEDQEAEPAKEPTEDVKSQTGPSESSENETIEEVKVEPKRNSSYFALSSFLFLIIITAVSKFLLGTTNEAWDLLQSHLIMLQIRVEDASGVDMEKFIVGVLGSIACLATMKTLFASEKRLKAIIEIIWGFLVCSVVFAGLYFTYDFTAN